jgi:hypothetical protein
MPSRTRLQTQIHQLSLADKQALQAWLAADIEQAQQPPDIQIAPGREVVETHQSGRITYQCERIKCGKPNCRCAVEGSLHGPYWYGYRKEKGRLKSWYIGKNLKLEDEEASATLEST